MASQPRVRDQTFVEGPLLARSAPPERGRRSTVAAARRTGLGTNLVAEVVALPYVGIVASRGEPQTAIGQRGR